MKTKAGLLIYFIIAVSLIISGCGKDEEDDDRGYSLEVITYKGGFEGYYKVDDNAAVFFVSTVAAGNSNYYTFSQKIEPQSSVYISATAVDNSAYSMQIFLYLNGAIVGTPATFTQTTDSSGNKSIVSGTFLHTITSSTDTTSK